MVKNWWWEAGVTPSAEMKRDIAQCFRRFLSYLGTEELRTDSETATAENLDWLVSTP